MRGKKKMCILKYEGGYVNAERIESYGLHEGIRGWQICAYAPANAVIYTLGRSMSEENAQKRLDYLAKWLAENEHGLLDVMDVWEEDYA